MSNLPGVEFPPWVGSFYGRESRFGIGLLLLGEAHYNYDLEFSEPGSTPEGVRSIAEQYRYRYFTMIAEVLHGTEKWIDDDVPGLILEDAAYYSFVQSIVPSPGTPPTARQWHEAQNPFQAVLRCLQPDAVLVLGERLSEHILNKPDHIAFETIGNPAISRIRKEEAIPAFGKLWATAKQQVTPTGSIGKAR